MCISFISRKNNILIGMNFDNNGMEYSIDPKPNDWFIVNVDGGRGKYPSFGINKNGLFFNNLIVDSNGKGLYRRPSVKVTHTSKFISDIVSGVIREEKIGEYLENVEVVNTPNQSTHNMIIDTSGNVYIVEPGRGVIYSPYSESDYFIMTNKSVIDMKNDGNYVECNRYNVIKKELENKIDVNGDNAFKILEKAFQNEGEWKTELSIVFSKKDGKVYYCSNREITNISEYAFV